MITRHNQFDWARTSGTGDPTEYTIPDAKWYECILSWGVGDQKR